MNRLLTISIAAALAAAPVVTGLAGSAAFAHSGPAQVSTTRLVDDKGGLSKHAEPGDDKGGRAKHAEPGDDKGGRAAGGSGRRGDDGAGHL